MSVSQLERVFKQATHSSVWHYITLKRLAAARERIESGSSATDASLECGFGDYSSFYRAYVKEYGRAPYVKKNTK
jgi:AraC-like DNA-binding protein